MEGPSLLHRFGGHGGIATEWEIRMSRDQNPVVANIIACLPSYRQIQHSDNDRQLASDWLILPEGVSAEDAGRVVGYLSSGDEEKLRSLLDEIDRTY
jgi:hypothetical protein